MSKHTIQETLLIPEDYAGLRADQAIHRLLADYSRMCVTRWIKQAAITVDGLTIRPSDKVRGGEQVVVDVSFEVATHWEAQAIALNIVHEDEALIVINKPPGLVVHPGAGNPDATLVNALLHHAPQLEQLPRAGLIHRLDKETSGLLIVAKTLITYHSLVKTLQARNIHREYIALVNGIVTAGSTVDAPIGRHPRARTKMAVITRGKPATTHYRIREKYPAHTLLTVQLETGRTHQIRVHMAHIHHPVVGDRLYGGRQHPPAGLDEASRQAVLTFPRQALHAFRLQLKHPLTEAETTFSAAIPADMQALITQLQQAER